MHDAARLPEHLPAAYGNEGLLILRRKLGEKIVIDEQITLVITEVRGPYVKVGIDAPRTLDIRRAELPPKPTTEGGDDGSDQ